MAAVILQNVSKVFTGPRKQRIHAVKEFNVTVADGEVLVLVGPSGAGKTTVLRLIAGLEEPTTGDILVDGTNVNRVPAEKRDVAMVFQSFALYPHMTVGENIGFPLKLRKSPKAEITAQVKAAAEILGLTDLLDRKPAALSGGERQRVALGRAIVRKPKVFLFDEPLSNLDTQMRSQMRAEISRLRQHLSATMIYVTHDQVEAMTLGDRIVVMNEGVVQQTGRTDDLYARPANIFVAGFIGSPPMNFFNGTFLEKDGFAFTCAPENPHITLSLDKEQIKSLRVRINTRIVLGLRPEDIAMATSSDAPNSIPATVELIEPTGADTLIHLQNGSLRFVLRASGGAIVHLGEEIQVAFCIRKAHFFDFESQRRVDVIS